MRFYFFLCQIQCLIIFVVVINLCIVYRKLSVIFIFYLHCLQVSFSASSLQIYLFIWFVLFLINLINSAFNRWLKYWSFFARWFNLIIQLLLSIVMSFNDFVFFTLQINLIRSIIEFEWGWRYWSFVIWLFCICKWWSQWATGYRAYAL